MKKIVAVCAVALFAVAMNVNAQEKAKEGTKKECSKDEKKSCDKDKKAGCCAKKAEKK